jgi:hypothetical protein
MGVYTSKTVKKEEKWKRNCQKHEGRGVGQGA